MEVKKSLCVQCKCSALKLQGVAKGGKKRLTLNSCVQPRKSGSDFKHHCEWLPRPAGWRSQSHLNPGSCVSEGAKSPCKSLQRQSVLLGWLDPAVIQVTLMTRTGSWRSRAPPPPPRGPGPPCVMLHCVILDYMGEIQGLWAKCGPPGHLLWPTRA